MARKAHVNTERIYRIMFMPPGHPIILLKCNKFNMEKGLLVSGEWYNCGIWFYLPLKVGRGDVHSRGGLGRRGILSPSSLWQICWLVFEVCDMVQLLFLLSNYKIIYHDIIFCTNRSNHYKTSPLRVRYLQIYQQSHYVKIHFLTQVFCKLYLIILV